MKRPGKVLRRALCVLVWAYPLSLLCVYAFLRATAETFWGSALAVYLPPQGYLFPAPLIVLAALWVGPKRLVLVPLGSVLFVVYFVMGFHFSFRSASSADLTVVSMNVDSAHRGSKEVVQGILEHDPDLVFLQEIAFRGEELAAELKTRLSHVVVSGQFVVASRYPLSEPKHPGSSFLWGRERTPQFISLEMQTPGGPVALYNVHPGSPRHAFMAVRGQGFTKEIKSGRLFRGEAAERVRKNVDLRRFDLESAARSALQGSLPTIVAGDLNLTHMSPLFDQAFGAFSDSFADAGIGFGFTFPSKILWMRLDRILAIRGPRFVDSYVACRGLSDHMCVVAKLELWPPST